MFASNMLPIIYRRHTYEENQEKLDQTTQMSDEIFYVIDLSDMYIILRRQEKVHSKQDLRWLPFSRICYFVNRPEFDIANPFGSLGVTDGVEKAERLEKVESRIFSFVTVLVNVYVLVTVGLQRGLELSEEVVDGNDWTLTVEWWVINPCCSDTHVICPNQYFKKIFDFLIRLARTVKRRFTFPCL